MSPGNVLLAPAQRAKLDGGCSADQRIRSFPAVILKGTVEVAVGDSTRVLRRGGGYELIGRQPYTLRNIGKTVAVVVCACTPPMF